MGVDRKEISIHVYIFKNAAKSLYSCDFQAKTLPTPVSANLKTQNPQFMPYSILYGLTDCILLKETTLEPVTKQKWKIC